MPFQRPTLPYNNISLPNSNRYTSLSNSGTPRPPTAEMVDADINYLVDTANILEEQINDVAAGAIPGSNNPNNANHLLTTNGDPDNPILSWIKVGQNQYEDGSISSRALANQAVATNNIQLGAITNPLIAPNSVGTNNLLNDSVSTAKIADSAVIHSKIADQNVITSKLGDGAVTNSKLSPLSITSDKLAALAVTNNKIGPLAVSNEKLQDSSVTNNKIANLTVGTSKIADSAIIHSKIADQNVITSKLGDGAVTNSKISDVTFQKFSGAFFMCEIVGGVVTTTYNVGITFVRTSPGVYTATLNNFVPPYTFSFPMSSTSTLFGGVTINITKINQTQYNIICLDNTATTVDPYQFSLCFLYA